MATFPTPAEQVAPNLLRSLRAGFDTIANHILVIIFPVLLDLWLWLGPHAQLKTLLLNALEKITSSPSWEAAQSTAMLENYQEILQDAAIRMNLMMSLRSFPVGIPSIMAARLPIEIPGGKPLFWDVTNLWLAIGLGCLLFLLGLVIGSLYYSLVAQAAIEGKIAWRKAVREWPWAMLQVFSLTLALVMVLLVISLPVSCAMTMMAWWGISAGQVGIFLMVGALLWIGFPLVFTPHGIFMSHNNVLLAVRKSIRVTRLTLPTTSLLFLAILVVSQGFDILWRIPPEDSWLTLIGMTGHAFITSALLATTFVYFRDADNWSQKLLEKLARPPVDVSPPESM